MAKLSKRQKLIREKVDSTRAYTVDEAVALLAELGQNVKFKESVDVAVNLGVDARKSDQVVRSSTVLPHGTGKTVRVAVFTQGANAEKATAAGADVVGMDDLADEVKKRQYGLRRGYCHSGCHACGWSAGPDPWSARPDAEPEGWYCNCRR